MKLISLSYSEFEGVEKSWSISEANFFDINLVVGKNSAGKSRLLSVIHSLTRILAGKQGAFDSGNYLAKIEINGSLFEYEIKFNFGNVDLERLNVNGELKLERQQDGSGKIWANQNSEYMDFKVPPSTIVALSRLDEIQHQFLIELNRWANQVAIYFFGSDFGKNRIIGLAEAESFFRNPNASFSEDPTNLVGVYSTAFLKYREPFDRAIIEDMSFLGYELSDIGSDNLQDLIKLPFAALGIFAVEKDLNFKNPQQHISQGMFRALALCIHLNVCIFSGIHKLILIDDIGEGLDYERSTKVINLVINKSKLGSFQVIMTTNDRFVMNQVPLEYWSVLVRKAGVVKLFNRLNSEKKFEDFKYLGLSNFDFYSSDFLSGAQDNG